MSGRGYNPARGDILIVDFSPQAGTEMAGRHHALVLSEQRFNVATGWIVACPITRQIKGSPFEVPLPPGPGRRTVGCVVASELRTLDWQARPVRFVEKAPEELVNSVRDIACAVIGCADA